MYHCDALLPNSGCQTLRSWLLHWDFLKLSESCLMCRNLALLRKYSPPRPPPVWENDQEHIYLTRLLSYVGKFICQICNMFPCLCSNSWSDNFIKMKDKYLAWPTQPILMSLRNTPFTYSPKVRSFPNRCLSTSHHWFRYMTLTIRCKYCVHIAPTLQKWPPQ